MLPVSQSDPLHTLRDFPISSGHSGRLYSLPALEEAGLGAISRLPVSLRVVLESIVRNCDGTRITADHVRLVAGWQARSPRTAEIPFVVARILLQDFTGVPLLCDLAAMRSAAVRLNRDPTVVEPLVPLDLVIDHSVQIDHFNSPQALGLNMRLEFQRNAERLSFIKWGMQAFPSLTVVPPGIGIVHQVNLEHLSPPIWQRDGVYFPDTVVGTDSHTTMINGLGVVGWGVGGIEAEAAMLGHPLYLLLPDVVGVHLHGALPAGATATDLVLLVTQTLRQARVVGTFVEFFGSGTASLTVPDRATLANMAPEYGATIGFFAVDEETLAYLIATGRDPQNIAVLRAYLMAQGLFGTPAPGQLDYTRIIDIDLASVVPCVAGPKRPQDRIPLGAVKKRFDELLSAPEGALEGGNGYGKPQGELTKHFPLIAHSDLTSPAPPITSDTLATTSIATGTGLRHEVEMVDASQTPEPTVRLHLEPESAGQELGHGDILIAAITSCTNTSNPGVMLAAGLLAKKAVERGLRVGSRVKTSLAPGSRVVTAYLDAAGLLSYLERLGFWVTAYGCTTCIGNSGALDPRIEETIARHGLVCAAVLSGNRNFEARIHPSIRANFLMSPPLVIAFALAGRIDIDPDFEPLGFDTNGRPVYLRELWPTAEEIAGLMHYARDPAVYRARYHELTYGNPEWNAISVGTGKLHAWEPTSTYIVEPPFFHAFTRVPIPPTRITGARALAIFSDSLTTDHISPAGAIAPDSPAGVYLQARGVAPADFNSYGARRGNHEVMMRGTFANVRILNLMLPPRADGSSVVGGMTLFQPSGELLTIYDAAMRYVAEGTPSIIFAGQDYGSGSSRDWAAKGPRLLGVRAVVARSFERIHRSNLVGMGVLPLQFMDGDSWETVALIGDELFDLEGVEDGIQPQQTVRLVIRGRTGQRRMISLRLRIDTPIEAEYYRHGGVLPYALRELLNR